MKKIKTLFERDFKNNGRITDKAVAVLDNSYVATEKVDGTNVRITVRKNTVVRVEKRRNPTKLEKAKGIIEPWYVDASEFEAGDKYIYEAVKGTDFSVIPDGEWSAEAYGEKIQGNPLKITGHKLFIFSHLETRAKHIIVGEPYDFNGLKEWLPKQKSTINPDCIIEGIVWWKNESPLYKIKNKDFKS